MPLSLAIGPSKNKTEKLKKYRNMASSRMLKQRQTRNLIPLVDQGEQRVQCALNQASLALAGDPGSVEAGGELVVVVEDLDVHVFAVEEDHGLHAA
jgi:hypothetical protein